MSRIFRVSRLCCAVEISALEAGTRKVCWAFRVFLFHNRHPLFQPPMLRVCNNFIKLLLISGKARRVENIRRLITVNPRRAELTFRYNLGMHVEA